MKSKVRKTCFSKLSSNKRFVVLIIFLVGFFSFSPDLVSAQQKTESAESKIKRLKKEKLHRKKQKKKAIKAAKKDHLSLQGNTTRGKSRKKQMKKMERDRKRARRAYR